MKRRRTMRACWSLPVFASLASSACADQVIGTFAASMTSSDSGPGSSGVLAATASDGALGSSDGESDGGTGSGTGTGAGGFVPPGCFGDDFEDGVVDPELWNTWAEENSSYAEAGGRIELTPPTYGLFDTGLVTSYLYEIPFQDAWARMQIVAPPVSTRPVVLFLQIVEEPRVLSIHVSEGTIAIAATESDVPIFSESFPADPYPGWIGIRAAGGLVHFETSDDGASWSILGTHDMPAAFTAAHPLIMAQTYGDDVEGGIVAVDNFEACVQ